MSEKEPKTEIAFSMQNLLDKSTIWSLMVPTKYYANLAIKAGYDGIEYFPNRIFPDIQGRTGRFSDFAKKSIRSGHQSWRSEKTFQEAKRHSNPSLAILAFFLLPERNSSLKHLKKLQEEIGDIPLVIYPPHLWKDEKNHPPIFKDLSTKLVQPAPELLEHWGVNNLQEFIKETSRMGYDGLCLDTFHLRRFPTQGTKSKFEDWKDILPLLLPHTKEIHIGVGRDDFKSNFDSMAELKDLYFNKRETDIIPILETIRDFGWKGLITTEIPSKSLRSLIPKKPNIITPQMIVFTHRRIVENLSEVMKV